jgi:hypothetical protein
MFFDKKQCMNKMKLTEIVTPHFNFTYRRNLMRFYG